MKKMSKKSLYGFTTGLAVFAIAVAPIGASAVSDSTTVSVSVDSSIALSSGATTSLGTVVPGGTAVTATNTLSVDNNDIDGYTLTIQSSDPTSDLEHATTSDVIAASAGTPGAPVTLADDTWGYRLAGFTAGNYAGVTNAPVEIVNKNGTFVGDETIVTYATKVSTSKPAGAYSDSVTYTALVK